MATRTPITDRDGYSFVRSAAEPGSSGPGGPPTEGEGDGGGRPGGGGWPRWRVVALVALGLGLVALALAVVLGPGTTGDETAPNFTAPSLRQPAPPVRLSSFQGRPVIINFFAAWCTPCRAELPLLASDYGPSHSRVGFVGVDVSDRRGSALDMVNAAGVTYPVGVDPSYHVSADLYHLFGLPTTVFVYANGNVAETYRGQLNKGVLRHWLSVIESGNG